MYKMAQLNITESMKKDFATLFSIPKEKLMGILNISMPGLSPQKVSEKVHKDFGIEQEKLEGIVRLIYSINQIKTPEDDYSKEQVVKDFVSSLSELSIDNFSENKAKEYLSEIVKPNENIFLTVQASNTALDREKLLQDFDILTDIRPIFDEDEAKGFVVIHTLKLEYTEGDNEHTAYLAIDNNDLNNFEKVIKRAKARELSAKSKTSGNFIDLAQE
jgi:hypothetical protein